MEKTENSVSMDKGLLFHLPGLIKNWNQNHNQVGDVVLFNVGRNTYISDNVAKIVPKNNPLVIATPKICGQFGERKAAFIIITTDILDSVSRLFETNVKVPSNNIQNTWLETYLTFSLSNIMF